MAEELLLTQEGYDKIVAEHEELVSVRRKEISEKLKEAISYGDLSENAEYDAAKNEQATLESEIAELEATIRTAIVLSDENISTDRVNVGVHVRVRYLDDDSEEEYALVGALESDPMANRISNECPIGAALLGKQVGDLVDVEAPDGVIKLEVLEITRPD